MIQHTTETVDLTGDLNGRVLYHVKSVFDFAHGTLVNTGDQVYSGTVAGSAPVMIHDDQFRFDVNLVNGAEGQAARHFIEHRGATLSRDELLAQVWRDDATPLTRRVDVHVAGLRQRIERHPKAPILGVLRREPCNIPPRSS